MTGPTEAPTAGTSAGSPAAGAVVAFRRPGMLLCSLSERGNEDGFGYAVLASDAGDSFLLVSLRDEAFRTIRSLSSQARVRLDRRPLGAAASVDDSGTRTICGLSCVALAPEQAHLIAIEAPGGSSCGGSWLSQVGFYSLLGSEALDENRSDLAEIMAAEIAWALAAGFDAAIFRLRPAGEDT